MGQLSTMESIVWTSSYWSAEYFVTTNQRRRSLRPSASSSANYHYPDFSDDMVYYGGE
jgi:hypothetical protein